MCTYSYSWRTSRDIKTLANPYTAILICTQVLKKKNQDNRKITLWETDIIINVKGARMPGMKKDLWLNMRSWTGGYSFVLTVMIGLEIKWQCSRMAGLCLIRLDSSDMMFKKKGKIIKEETKENSTAQHFPVYSWGVLQWLVLLNRIAYRWNDIESLRRL